MANTEAILSVTLDSEHLAGVLRLSEEANWNQVGADWLLMMAHGHAIGRISEDGNLIASALALPFGHRLGWISMVLVTAGWRRRGLASELVSHCIAWLEDRGIQPVLDATVAGAEVYRPLGFQTVRRITRWQHGGFSAASPGKDALPSIGMDDLARLAEFDGEVFGAPRPFVLLDLISREGAASAHMQDENGYALSRQGRVATQIGPLSASNPQVAIHLLQDMLRKIEGAVFIDAYEDQRQFCAALEEMGFRPQRGFERMVKGSLVEFGDRSRAFAAAGPELG